MVGGMSGVEQDVIPYGSVLGNRARLAGLNIVGLKRRGFSRAEIASLRKAYRLLLQKKELFLNGSMTSLRCIMETKL